MARTPVRARATGPAAQRATRPTRRREHGQRARQPLRFWYVPLLLAVLLPLVLWAGMNVAAVVLANRDLGGAPARPLAAPTAAPDQALLTAAISLVQTSPCPPAPAALQAQPTFAGATWTARRSEANRHAYYVAAADPATEHLLGIWQVEGGQVWRLQDSACPALPAGPPARLAEAAVLFSPHRPGAGQ